MTQDSLASDSGLSKSYIAKVESGQRKIGMSGLEKISDALDVPMDILLQGEISKNTCIYEKYAHPMMDLLADCTLQEQEIIFDTMQHLKRTLISHRNETPCITGSRKRR